MKLLVVGGTQFLGRHLVEAALGRGWDVTLFNRGQTNPELFPEAEHLHGDRDGGLAPLEGRSWDFVIDTCGYVPRVVRQSAELLKDAAERYVFISTLSVFADLAKPNQDESGKLARLEDESVEEVNGETYGGLKVLCERVVEEVYREYSLIIRPGLIVGPHDPTNRFTYWPTRLARGGEVLAPGRPERPLQIIDERDLSGWILDLIERGGSGIYNATGPDYTMTMGEVLEACRGVAANDSTLTWVDENYLLKEKVEPYSELPLWLPEKYAAMESFDCRKAIAAGLGFRPLEETIRDTLQWAHSQPEGPVAKSGVAVHGGLDADRERQLLEGWHSLN